LHEDILTFYFNGVRPQRRSNFWARPGADEFVEKESPFNDHYFNYKKINKHKKSLTKNFLYLKLMHWMKSQP
jgi:hypothetical protein